MSDFLERELQLRDSLRLRLSKIENYTVHNLTEINDQIKTLTVTVSVITKEKRELEVVVQKMIDNEPSLIAEKQGLEKAIKEWKNERREVLIRLATPNVNLMRPQQEVIEKELQVTARDLLAQIDDAEERMSEIGTTLNLRRLKEADLSAANFELLKTANQKDELKQKRDNVTSELDLTNDEIGYKAYLADYKTLFGSEKAILLEEQVKTATENKEPFVVDGEFALKQDQPVVESVLEVPSFMEPVSLIKGEPEAVASFGNDFPVEPHLGGIDPKSQTVGEQAASLPDGVREFDVVEPSQNLLKNAGKFLLKNPSYLVVAALYATGIVLGPIFTGAAMVVLGGKLYSQKFIPDSSERQGR